MSFIGDKRNFLIYACKHHSKKNMTEGESFHSTPPATFGIVLKVVGSSTQCHRPEYALSKLVCGTLKDSPVALQEPVSTPGLLPLQQHQLYTLLEYK
jgi:hypothetical protein